MKYIGSGIYTRIKTRRTEIEFLRPGVPMAAYGSNLQFSPLRLRDL